ncbi:unnamed protein product [Closterium sp. Naga37s-1]|nr:unnamed protein product [Closterium sp. Naga37s-1]
MTDAATDIPPLEEPPVHIPDISKVQRLSWKPRAFLFPQFLSEAECDYIVNYSRPRMERSTVLSNSGQSVQDSIRTSDGSFIVKYENAVIQRIEERVAAWTFLPIENQEAMQVLRYRDGQEYGAHWDYIDPAKAPTPGGPRYATVLMYLSNVEMGGETAFPESEEDTVVKDDSWSDCGKKGIAVPSTPHLNSSPCLQPSQEKAMRCSSSRSIQTLLLIAPPSTRAAPCWPGRSGPPPSGSTWGALNLGARGNMRAISPPSLFPAPSSPSSLPLSHSPLPVPAKPRKGDALLFFSLHPDTSFDRASLHAGCPVLAGEKWSATKWIHPRKGDALLFFSLHPDTSFDLSSLHAGCPVLAGEKWSATKWIHVGAFDLPPRDPSVCADDNENCEHWASIGECERNKAYMVGAGGVGQQSLGQATGLCPPPSRPHRPLLLAAASSFHTRPPPGKPHSRAELALCQQAELASCQQADLAWCQHADLASPIASFPLPG